MDKKSKKAIIVGASSGIGEALAIILGKHGYTLGLMARRVALMQQLAKKIPTPTYIKFIDVSEPYTAIQNFNELIHEMEGVDLVIINSGIGSYNPEFEWDIDKKVIDVNVMGFTAIADAAMRYFIERKSGHLVGISSITALRGFHMFPVYGASKAYISNLLQAFQKIVYKSHLPIIVTDIKPGYVDTALIEPEKDIAFWVSPSQKAAEQIYQAIHRRKKHAYITKRWRLMAWIIKLLPDWLYYKF